jgi:hypothetical protein
MFGPENLILVMKMMFPFDHRANDDLKIATPHYKPMTSALLTNTGKTRTDGVDE